MQMAQQKCTEPTTASMIHSDNVNFIASARVDSHSGATTFSTTIPFAGRRQRRQNRTFLLLTVARKNDRIPNRCRLDDANNPRDRQRDGRNDVVRARARVRRGPVLVRLLLLLLPLLPLLPLHGRARRREYTRAAHTTRTRTRTRRTVRRRRRFVCTAATWTDRDRF